MTTTAPEIEIRSFFVDGAVAGSHVRAYRAQRWADGRMHFGPICDTAIDALLGALTIEHARAYAQQTDRLIWIETELLDPADIGRRHAERVEDALIALLAKTA